MNTTTLLFAGLLVSGFATGLQAVDFSGHYTENFNSMGTAGTAAPSGWSFFGNLGGSSSTWTTSVPAASAGLGTANATLTASTSTSVSSNTAGYNYAAAASTSDRCLGSSPTSGSGVVWQLSLTNTAGSALSSLAIRYDTRRFTAASAANDLPGHWLFLSLDGGTTWTNAASLNPSITTVPNSTGTSVFVENNLTLASSWANGGTLLLRWIDDNATQTSPDQIIGLDNVSIAKPAAAPLDSALTLNTNQWATMGSATALGATNLTLECWFRKTGAGTTTTTGSGGVTAVPLIAKGRGEADGDNRDCNYFLGINAAGQLTADFEQAAATSNGGSNYAAGQNFPVVGSTVLSDHTWYHVAATYDVAAGQWKLYVNGVAETLTVPSGSPATFAGVSPRGDSIQHFAIGTAMTSTGAAAGSFQGVIDEVRVWNVVRSASEILAEKDNQLSSPVTGLIGRYGFTEGTGSSIAGVPGTAPAGTLVATPLWSAGATFGVVANVPPTVSITAPSTGASFFSPASFNVEATASDSDGSVSQVEFLRNGVVVATDTEAPYSYPVTDLPVGTYSFTARATDDDNAATTSAAVAVSVTLDPNNLPTNTALFFDGVNDYVTMGAAPELGVGGPPANGLTLECWFRKDGTGVTSSSGSGGVSAVPLFGKGRGESDGNNLDCNYFFGITPGGLLAADFEAYPASGITSGQNYPVTGTNTPIANGQWYHAAVTYDGATSTWKLYLDGIQVGTASAPAGALPRYDSIQHFGIGSALNSAGAREGAFAGAIDEVRVWNFARSAAEIAQTKDLAIESAPGLVGRFGLDEGTGTTTASSAGVSSGTLTNGPVWSEGAPVVENDAPTVAVTSPLNGATLTAPAAFTIEADADDTDGTIFKVEFLLGGNLLGEDFDEPYTFAVSGLAAGTYSITARASDNYGTQSTSTTVSITVDPPVTALPTVSITSPADGADFIVGVPILIQATANDSDGNVVKVEFFDGATKLGDDDMEPFEYNWNGAALGSHTLTAVATDNLTATGTSAAITVDVVPNQAPTISLTSPADNATNVGTAGTVTLNASVSDPESQPLSVTFYGRNKAPAPGPDFTLVTLPDTQFYSQNTGGTRLANFTSQTNWIVSSKNTLNTAFVAHMGDMVQDGDAIEQQWINADSAMDIIEDPLTTLLTHGIPWGGAPGNHDQQPIGSPDGASTFWNTYFGTSRWAGRSYWGGNYSTNNDNNYQLFSASGLDFIVINLEYRPSANQAVLDWADALLKAHPNRRAIVTSHWLIGTGNPAAWGGHGQAVYDNLKDNPNLFLMLCGHIHGEGQRADVFEGRTVRTVLQDYQSRANGGDSWLRYFVFSPANNTISAKTYQTTTGTFETDTDSQFTLSYDMGGPGPWTELGTVSASGGTATLEWTGLAPDSDYEWYAAVSDGTNAVGSPTRSFSTSTNLAPSVTLDTPLDGATIAKPASVNFTATAADTDGTVAKVEFFSGSTKLGDDSEAPYEFSWSPPSGSYAVSARATDSQGAIADSAVATITVNNPNNVSPTVAITQPTDGSSVASGTVNLAATASDSDGLVSKVEFFAGANKLGEDTTEPFTFAWSGAANGNYTLTAVATDNDGGATTSAQVAITIATPAVSTLIQKGATWKYLDNGSNQGTAWKETAFDDSTWASGPAVLGGGDTHVVTNINLGASGARYITTYLRRTFQVTGTAGVQKLDLNILRDDGAIVYINGTEVARQNMPAGAVDYLTNSSTIVSGNDETTYFPSVAAPLPALVEGTNVIAVELHQRDNQSSDLGFDLELIATSVPVIPTVTIAATDATAGEAGADQALAFTVTRSGPTTAALEVPLVASGSATSGDDFSGFLSPLTIPIGQASATLPLTVLPDALAEGAETVTLSLGSGAAFTAGSPASADATIADKPEQSFYFSNIADPAKRAPTADADGDGNANVIEYFMGSLPGDSNSRGVLEVPSTGTNTFQVRYPRAKNRPDVSGSLQWTSSLNGWFAGGQSNGTHTVTFAETVVSPPGADPEIVEATATISGPGEAPAIFVRLGVQ